MSFALFWYSVYIVCWLLRASCSRSVSQERRDTLWSFVFSLTRLEFSRNKKKKCSEVVVYVWVSDARYVMYLWSIFLATSFRFFSLLKKAFKNPKGETKLSRNISSSTERDVADLGLEDLYGSGWIWWPWIWFLSMASTTIQFICHIFITSKSSAKYQRTCRVLGAPVGY